MYALVFSSRQSNVVEILLTAKKAPSLERLAKRDREKDFLQIPSKRHSNLDQIPWKRIKSSPFPLDHIGYWSQKGTWPESFFKGDVHQLLAKKGSIYRRKRSNSIVTSSSASDERPREEKSAPYRNPSYPTFLSDDADEYKSFMTDHELGISNFSENLLERLLHSVSARTPPTDTIFRKEVFPKHLHKLRGKNESRILQDLSQLLVPSAESLATLGANDLNGIVESVNEGWNNCFPITRPRPQPDSAFGYGTTSFSDSQLNKLRPVLGDASFNSYFKSTFYMLFPFLTKEVKTGTMGLGIADNQNAHSMTIAVRAVVKLFELVGREKELHREILAFAISHNNESVRLYAYYPFIEGEKVTIWRRTADRFYLNADTMWKSWTFTTNVYDIFSAIHLHRIRSAIDDISPVCFQRSEPQSAESSGLSQ
jgi:hypothetical protein